MVKSMRMENELDSFVQVLELYDDSEFVHKRWKRHLNKGIAACIFIAAIPKAECIYPSF
jgi:alkyl hydroperoxide reductase subunit AhpC